MPDNLSPGPQRPIGVTSAELESALRETFTRQSAALPTCADPAGTVLRRARRVHRRRAVLGATMTAVTTLTISLFATQLAAPGDGSANSAFVGNPLDGPIVMDSTSHTPQPPIRRVEPPLVDVVVADALHSVSGQLIDLSATGTVVAARRADAGWLIVTSASGYGSTLWSVREGVAPHVILPAVDELVLAPDGRRIAWRNDDQMFVAPVKAGALGVSSPSAAPSDGRLVRFVGTGLLLARDQPGGGYDIWWPQRGSYAGSWAGSVTAVYGPLPDGRTLVGQVVVEPATRPCLALLDADRGLTPLRSSCLPPLAAGGAGAVSPDGRWLVAAGMPDQRDGETMASGASTGRVMAVDLRTAFDARPVVRRFDPPLTSDVIWLGPDTLVYAGGQGDLVRVTMGPVAVGGDAQVERVAVPAATEGDRMVVVSGCAGAPAQPIAPVMSCR